MSGAKVIRTMRTRDGAVQTTPSVVTAAQAITKRTIATETVPKTNVVEATGAREGAVFAVGTRHAARAASETNVAGAVAVILRALAGAVNAPTVPVAYKVVRTRTGRCARGTAPPRRT